MLRGGCIIVGVVCLGMAAGSASAQQCSGMPPCAKGCAIDDDTARCIDPPHKTVKKRTIEVVTTPPGAEVWVNRPGKPHKGKPFITPAKVTIGLKEEVTLKITMAGYQVWERPPAPGETLIPVTLEYLASLRFDLGQEPALAGAKVWLECERNGAWSRCQMGGFPEPCCKTITYLDSQPTRVVIEREGYDRYVAPLQLGAKGATVRPKLTPRAPVRDDFERSQLGDRYAPTTGHMIAGGKLRWSSTGWPLWMQLGLPAEAVIEVDATAPGGGDIKLLAWGDRGWNGDGKTGGTPGYVFTLGGWNQSPSAIARDNAQAGARVERRGGAAANQRYHFKIVRRGAKLDWFVDDMLIPYLSLVDPAPRGAGTPGFLGFMGFVPGQVIEFDNLVITPLALAKGRVRIKSNVPAGLGLATEARGSFGLGTTPWEAELAPGRYSYRIGASGYKEGLITFDIAAGGTYEFVATLEPLPPPTGRVELRPSVAAALSWSGGSRSASTQHDLDLPPGQYTFTLHHEGWPVQYRDASLTVDVIAGQTVRLGVTLEPAPRVVPEVTVKGGGGDDEEVPPTPSPTPKPKRKAPSKLDYRVRAASIQYQQALDARDEVGRQSVRNGLLTGMWGVCMMGGIGLGIYGGVADVELSTQLITLFSGAALAGTCYWRLLRQAFSPVSSSRWRTQQADEKLSKARYGLIAAIDAYNGGRRGSLLSRPAPPRLGFGLAVSDGLVVRDGAGHAGVGIEASALVNLGWLHPELAAEVDPDHEVVVARPGARVSLGRFFFLRGGAETAISGGTDDWALFGGLGVRLPISRKMSFQLAADFSRTTADEPTSTIRGRTGLSYGF